MLIARINVRLKLDDLKRWIGRIAEAAWRSYRTKEKSSKIETTSVDMIGGEPQPSWLEEVSA